MKVKELLSSPEKWTKGCAAKDSRGMLCPSDDPRACRWCLIGALMKCYGEDGMFRMLGMFYPRIPAVGTSHFNDVAVWNDAPERTFEDVQQLVTYLDI